MLVNIFEQSLLFFPLALGIYISYSILKIPDLTTDGSFVFGAALFGILVHAGCSPFLAMIMATLGGAVNGIIVSVIQIRLNIQPLLVGILMVFILTTLTLKLMGKPNLSLLNYPTIFLSKSKIITLLPLMTIFLIFGTYLLSSRLGLFLQAFGNNPTLLHLFGKNANVFRILGLSISNGLVGCSGALTAQSSGYVDIGMGTGIILVALGTVIIGRQFYLAFFTHLSFAVSFQLLCCFLGVIIYFSTINLLIAIGIDPIYLRLLVGICLFGFLAMTKEKGLASQKGRV